MQTDDDGDGYSEVQGDCDDGNPDLNPSALEQCDGIDNDCDDAIDDDDPHGVPVDAPTWYPDTDTDGYGTDLGAVASCLPPAGYSAAGGDCDDEDSRFHPQADEGDCTDPLDYNCDGSVAYADTDGDGAPACADCNDGDAAIHPQALEVCDGLDNNCDGSTDESTALDVSPWYPDQDGDGFGAYTDPVMACAAPTGYVANDLDCDDVRIQISPDALEVCDGVDNDCDQLVDEPDASDAPTWYLDGDGDGSGTVAQSQAACQQPAEYVAASGDCNDEDGAIHPLASELCDGIDNNCNSLIDMDDPLIVDASIWYSDLDGDGYGDPASPQADCSQPADTAENSDDCDDVDADLNPTTIWYEDADGDGFGDSTSSLTQCAEPVGYALASGDCDDGSLESYPGGTETCDGLDNDCNGAVDEGFGDEDGDGIANCVDVETCDGFDNDGDGLIDETCSCVSDGSITTLAGFTVKKVMTQTTLGSYGYLTDVEVAKGAYWNASGEGVLFTLNNAANTGAGIGVLDADGKFKRWLLDPDARKLPFNPYLEYAWDGVLYACTTVNGNYIYRILPDGTVQPFVSQGECEGIIYGDAGDGVNQLYAGHWSAGYVNKITSSGVITRIASNLPVVVDLAMPRPGSAFPKGVYALNQTSGGLNRITPDGKVTLAYPYSTGWGYGEEVSFAWPDSIFGDYFYHLSAGKHQVQRVAPSGSWEVVAKGGELSFGTYSTGAAFSTDGRFYYFTNEANIIWRMQGCDAPK